MPKKAEDLTGKNFGELIVREKAGSISRQAYWYCDCRCGNLSLVSSQNLKNGKSSSCGWCQRDDLTGKVFSRLTVLEEAGTMGEGRTKARYWYCECKCGTWTLTQTSALTTGKTKSCGCASKRFRKADEHDNFKHGGTMGGKQSAEYKAWQRIKRKPENLVSEWHDFRIFFRDVGWKPSEEHVLARYDIKQQHSPTNTYWKHPHEERAQRRSIKHSGELVCDPAAILSNFRAAEAVTA